MQYCHSTETVSYTHLDWLKQFLIEKKVAYILFGNHYYKTDEERVYVGTACEQEQWLVSYVDEAIAGMETGLYSYLCHPDLFMRGRLSLIHLSPK